MPAADWVSYEDAVRIVIEHAGPAGVENVWLAQALGRAAAEQIRSRVTHPPWNNSAMDGFAVRASDVRTASPEHPVTLPVSGDVPAGSFPDSALKPGTAVRVMTGAPVPDGATGVIRVEHTDRWGQGGGAPEQVTIYHGDDAERHIRLAGEDLEPGDILVERGEEITSAVIGVLSLTGVERLSVGRIPRVGVLANGDELVDFDRFDEVLAGRKIMNSNSHALAAQLRSEGVDPVMLGIAADDPGSLERLLSGCGDCDAVISSAGVSVGEHDHVKAVLDGLGMKRLFWRTNVRPGSAVLFGLLDEKPLWGVPGNPVSAMVSFEIFVRPAIRRMAGHTRLFRRKIPVRLADSVRTPAGVTAVLRVRLTQHEDGRTEALLTGPQGSGILTSMAAADGLLIVPEGIDRYEAGSVVEVLPLSPWERS